MDWFCAPLVIEALGSNHVCFYRWRTMEECDCDFPFRSFVCFYDVVVFNLLFPPDGRRESTAVQNQTHHHHVV